MWYVIQTLAGQENATLEFLERLVDSNVYDEVFVPQREVMRHRSGVWVCEREVLFPGYIFVITRRPEQFSNQLSSVPMFTRLLGGGGAFVPLIDMEVHVVSALIGASRIVGMSEGVVEGDKVRVLRGPLRDFDVPIVRVDRHKRAAYIRVSMLGRESVVKVGFEVLRKS